MTNKEKRLLLIDLCARLPYGVKVQNVLNGNVYELKGYLYCLPTALTTNYKPYLRPLSSMTEEEEKEFVRFTSESMHRFVCDATGRDHWFNVWEEEDWLDKHHFDYRGLIPMGLALKATEGMYKTE